MPFDFQSILQGELLELRPLRVEDFPDLYEVAADSLIWEQHPIKDRYKEVVFKEFFREALESGGALLAIDSKDNRVIGSSRFHGYDEERSEIEIGWTFLARSYWGGIYNGEMKQLMLRHAFRFVESVIFLISPQNVRSQRAVEKIGGIRAGERRDGNGRDSFVYRITASTFFPADSFVVIERTPTVEEYNHVRQAGGLTVKDKIAAQHGLARTLFGVCIIYNGATIGIGRVIGDGGLFYDIVDVAVVAEYQKKGVGKLIMDALMSYIDANARPSSLVCLMANKGIAPFYERYGFKARDPDMPGMIIRK